MPAATSGFGGRERKPSRVIEYHIDQVFDLPPDRPLTAAPPPGPSVRILDDGDDGGLCRRPPGTIAVEVSQAVTIITTLMDTAAYPAGQWD